nr:hypothetical protein [Tanacetum cinerariifolium]
KQEVKRIEEEQAAKAQNRKHPVCYDDDDDKEESNINSKLPPCSAVTPSEPVDSLIMKDEPFDTIPVTESDEFIKSCVENLKQEVKRIEEEQAAKAQNRKLPVCYDDDDDKEESNINFELPSCSAVTPSEPVDSLIMKDEPLDTIPATESDEFIKSCVENLVPNPSESESENGCNLPSSFTTFSNILFDANYEFDFVDNQSLHNEDVSEKIFSNPLFEEEIISIRIDQHHFNAESDLVESMLNRDSSVISSSLKIDSLLDEFVSELTLLKSIPPGIDKADCNPKNEIHFSKRLLYNNSSPRPSKELVFENSNAEIETFSPSPIPNKDSDSHMEEIDLSFNPDDPMPPSIEDDDNDSEGDNLFLERLLHNDPIPLLDSLDFSNVVRVFLPFFTYPPGLSHRCGTFKKFNTHCSHLNESPIEMLFSTYIPLDQLKYGGNWIKLSDLKQALRGRHPVLILS